MNGGNCGAMLAPNVAFCGNCGVQVSVAGPRLPPAGTAHILGPAVPPPPPGFPPAAPARGKLLAVALVLILVVVGAAVAAFFVFGGGGSGQCVGVSWNGSYYDYTRVYGYTEAECNAWCAEHTFGTNCYYEP